jgi:hypothetical protein
MRSPHSEYESIWVNITFAHQSRKQEKAYRINRSIRELDRVISDRREGVPGSSDFDCSYQAQYKACREMGHSAPSDRCVNKGPSKKARVADGST